MSRNEDEYLARFREIIAGLGPDQLDSLPGDLMDASSGLVTPVAPADRRSPCPGRPGC